MEELHDAKGGGRLGEVLSVPHRFMLDSGDSGGIRCIPEEWKLAEGSANIAIPVDSRSGGILTCICYLHISYITN